jgi:hypothetical protein
MKAFFATASLCGLMFAGAAGAQTTVITFDNGWEGFNSMGNAWIKDSGGNPGAHARTVIHNFGTEWWTDTNPAFIGDFSGYQSMTISIDVKVESIMFFGQHVPRNLILDLRSFSHGQGGYQYSSVWYNLGTMTTGMPWTTFSVTFDPNSADMPAGWGGTGDEDPNTFEPVLPANLTFADILQSVEQLAFTTFEPGWFYGFTDFDIRVDNIRIELVSVPAPGALAVLVGFGLMPRRRRRACGG